MKESPIIPQTSKYWKPLKEAVDSVAARNLVLLACVTFLFPIVENVLVALWFGIKAGGAVAGWVLLVVALTHVVLGILSLGGGSCAVKALPEAIEMEEKLHEVQRELGRRTVAYGMVREAINSLNTSTCNLPAWCSNGYEAGLNPIVKQFASDISTTLGVTSNQFTIEIYIELGGIEELTCTPDPSNEIYLPYGNSYMKLAYFFSPQQTDRRAVEALGHNLPAILGAAEDVPAIHKISEYPGVFLQDGKPLPHVYFRRFATVPMNWVCSDMRLGIVVLTSMQEDDFSEDVLDTLQFLASLVSNYHSSYNKCVFENRERQRKEEQKKRREEAKRIRQSQQSGSSRQQPNEEDGDHQVDEDGEPA